MMSNLSWITESQINVAKQKAKEILKDFCWATDGEQSWTEIEIDGKFFDIECYQEDEKDDVVCNVYPTYRTNCETWRETDGKNWIRLFTNKEVTDD
tara:strand:- start:2313 stop:2600 length:288 start_codon:yes stop_codon:yes gene_type:complete